MKHKKIVPPSLSIINTKYKRKYNEMVGNVISERKRTSNPTPIHKVKNSGVSNDGSTTKTQSNKGFGSGINNAISTSISNFINTPGHTNSKISITTVHHQ